MSIIVVKAYRYENYNMILIVTVYIIGFFCLRFLVTRRLFSRENSRSKCNGSAVENAMEV